MQHPYHGCMGFHEGANLGQQQWARAVYASLSAPILPTPRGGAALIS
jgi:hypothetical protein